MRRDLFLRYLGAALGGAALAPTLAGCGGGGEDAAVADGRTALTETPAAVEAELSQAEIDGLMFMREEEKLAHDVYVALGALWGTQVFANIAESETQHTEAVRQLILAHGLEDPAADKAAGEFVDAGLQALYDTLVAQGGVSELAALGVGCLIEEKDLWDIREKIAEIEGEPDLVQVYEHLMCGSRNHLRAFSRVLTQQGGSYVPEYISQAEWDAVASSSNEQCGG